MSIYIYLFTPKQKKSLDETKDFKNINDEKKYFSGINISPLVGSCNLNVKSL
ncbi:hypothetical protein EMIT036CA2_10190 [Chryseobacterium sp. IT-36CA2]